MNLPDVAALAQLLEQRLRVFLPDMGHTAWLQRDDHFPAVAREILAFVERQR